MEPSASFLSCESVLQKTRQNSATILTFKRLIQGHVRKMENKKTRKHATKRSTAPQMNGCILAECLETFLQRSTPV